jgi:hypothetical protein
MAENKDRDNREKEMEKNIESADRVADREASALLGRFPLVSWSSIFAGFFIAVLCYAILLMLGVGIGGVTLSNMIEGPGGPGNGFAVSSAIWICVAAIIALFIGGYYGGRLSHFLSGRVGAGQGFVIASLFFLLMLSQLGSGLSWIGSSITGLASSAGSGAVTLAGNDQVQNVLNRAIGGRNLKDSPSAVAQGLAVRLLRGDRNGAVTYLANETGMSRAEAQRRINDIATDVQNGAEQAGITAANVVGATGWTLFATLLLGAIAAALGGAVGARSNTLRPLQEEEARRRGVTNFRPALQV